MSTLSADVTPKVSAVEVHSVLGQHMLVDGLHLVMDLEKSHGSYLYDDLRGHEVLDLFGAFSTIAIGYNHPKLSDADFLKRLVPAALTKPSNSDIYTPQLAAFVEAFSRTVPAAFREHLFFIEGGALAVENALKAAFDWKVRKNLAAGRGELGQQIIHFRQAFHGRSGYTLSLTNTADPRKTQYFPKFKWPRITNPALSFPVSAEVEEQVAQEEEKAVNEIKQVLADNPNDIAALIIEPIQGEGGDNHFRSEFLQRLRQLADENEFLLIFDEVQTGFGTTGKWWCFEHLAVEPDIFCFGKKTQVCGIAATRRLDEVDSVFKVSSRINSTWGGNLVDMVRCRRIIEIIEEDALLDNATEVGSVLLSGLQDLARQYPGTVTNPRGRGLFLAFDLPDTEKRNRVLAALNQADVLGLASGFRAIRFRPALTLDPDTAREGLSRIGTAISRVA
ncbi:MAG TPA: L-lysine 6-transaminase [Thermoanaerobaculia bacterium]|nr:L-lysine 6-transaminase [Thermoanaerobaculia bacterium]